MANQLPKIYDININDDGSVRITTDLSNEDVKSLLEFAVINLLMMGYTVPSLQNFFQQQEEISKDILENLPVDKLHKA